MVKAIVNIDNEANKVLNHLKVEYGLRDKSQAINRMAKEFKKFVKVEPGIRPEYIKKLMKIRKGRYREIEDFAKEFGLK